MCTPLAAWFTEEIYAVLRALAQAKLSQEAPGHTLQATALVHEVFLKLSPQERASCGSEEQFVAIASQAMRRILVDHARKRRALKRVPVEGALAAEGDGPGPEDPPFDVEVLDQALAKLAMLNARQSRIVELRFFGGLSMPQIGIILDVPEAVVRTEWRIARAWLGQELGERVDLMRGVEEDSRTIPRVVP